MEQLLQNETQELESSDSSRNLKVLQVIASSKVFSASGTWLTSLTMNIMTSYKNMVNIYRLFIGECCGKQVIMFYLTKSSEHEVDVINSPILQMHKLRHNHHGFKSHLSELTNLALKSYALSPAEEQR